MGSDRQGKGIVRPAREPVPGTPLGGSCGLGTLMPLELILDPARQLAIGTARGPLTPADLRAAFLSMIDHPDFKPGMNFLLDVTDGLDRSFTRQELEAHIEFVLAYQPRRGIHYRVAIVAPRDLDFGMFRVYEGLAVQVPFEIEVFRERAPAEVWATNRL